MQRSRRRIIYTDWLGNRNDYEPRPERNMYVTERRAVKRIVRESKKEQMRS